MKTQRFGKYDLHKKLATGGMAEVWLARQTGIEGFEKFLVLKRILPHLAEDPEFVQMFLNEAKIAARFNHPNIAQIFDLGETNGTYFIAMELVRGEDLGRVMRKAWASGDWVKVPLAMRIVAGACEGLHYAHTKADESGRPLKVVHRDISPQNILISFDGAVKLVDFGIAKAADQASMTKSGAIKGKFSYMSPEQAAGKPLDHRSDVFSIGLVLYELLTGHRPLKRDNELATLQAALECQIELPSRVADVAAEVDPLVMKALAKSPDDRYPDARAFQVALEGYLAEQRLVAGSIQISELMARLFADRLADEAKLGIPAPSAEDSSGVGGGASKSASSVSRVDQTRAYTEEENEPAPTSNGKGQNLVGPTVISSSAVMSWDAPPGAELPGRKRGADELPRRMTNPGATSIARPSASGEVPPALPRRSSLQRIPESGKERTRPPVEDAPPGEPVARRKTTKSALHRSIPVREEPEPEAVEAPPAFQDESLLKEALAADDRQQGRRKSAFKLFVRLAVVAGLGIGAWALRAPATKFLAAKPTSSGVPVYLTVECEPKARVLVQHPPSEGGELVDLGETPMHRVKGAHVGDAITLENNSVGLHFEQVIAPIKPNATVKISRRFQFGSFRPQYVKGLHGLAIYDNGIEIGKYLPEMGIRLVEGKHTLEIRDEKLNAPIRFEIQIRPNETTQGPRLADPVKNQ
jgi:eukaryotic-like serine/threonine-protein kinase